MTGIVAFFQALPQFLQLINGLGSVMQRLVAYAEQNNLNGWINNLESSIDQLERAKTPEEKLGAAQSLVGIIRGLGPQ